MLFQKKKAGFLSCLLCAITLLLAITQARAAPIRWNNPNGGDFSLPANWEGGIVPGANDHGVFDLAAAYTVTWSATVSNNGCHVRQGTVIFDLNGNTNWFMPIGGIGCGETDSVADLTVIRGAFRRMSGSVSGFPVVRGAGTTVRVNNGGCYEYQRANMGSGTISILDGASVTNYAYQTVFSGKLDVLNGACLGQMPSYVTFNEGSVTTLNGEGTVLLAECRISCGETGAFYVRNNALVRGWGGLMLTVGAQSCRSRRESF